MAHTKRVCLRAKGREVSIITSAYAVSLSPQLDMFNILFTLLGLYIKTIREAALVITLHFNQRLIVWTRYLLLPLFSSF